MSRSDYLRLFARDVGVEPPIGGATNVQAALGGVPFLGDQSEYVQADTATPVTCDGMGHSVDCLIAAPPAWMDNASNIILPGLYTTVVVLHINTPPTATGKLLLAGWNPGANDVRTLEDIALAGVLTLNSAIVVGAVDVPLSFGGACKGETDVTGVVDVTLAIARLAFPAP